MDRLQRILARQQEREQKMREKEASKNKVVEPPKDLAVTVASKRWERTAYGWERHDEIDTLTSNDIYTSREAHQYSTITTNTFLPAKEYRTLNLGQALERLEDYSTACRVLETLMETYYATTALTTQKLMETDLLRAAQILSTQPQFQRISRIKRCLHMLQVAVRVVSGVVTPSSSEPNHNKWECKFCGLRNSVKSFTCSLCRQISAEADVFSDFNFWRRSNDLIDVNLDENLDADSSSSSPLLNTTSPRREGGGGGGGNDVQLGVGVGSVEADKMKKHYVEFLEKLGNTCLLIIELQEKTFPVQEIDPEACWFEDLPNEVLLGIFGYLTSPLDVFTVLQVCRRWNQLIDDQFFKTLVMDLPHLPPNLKSAENVNWRELYIQASWKDLVKYGLWHCSGPNCGYVWWRADRTCPNCGSSLPRSLLLSLSTKLPSILVSYTRLPKQRNVIVGTVWY
jgi:rubrerythrin